MIELVDLLDMSDAEEVAPHRSQMNQSIDSLRCDSTREWHHGSGLAGTISGLGPAAMSVSNE